MESHESPRLGSSDPSFSAGAHAGVVMGNLPSTGYQPSPMANCAEGTGNSALMSKDENTRQNVPPDNIIPHALVSASAMESKADAKDAEDQLATRRTHTGNQSTGHGAQVPTEDYKKTTLGHASFDTMPTNMKKKFEESEYSADEILEYLLQQDMENGRSQSGQKLQENFEVEDTRRAIQSGYELESDYKPITKSGKGPGKPSVHSANKGGSKLQNQNKYQYPYNTDGGGARMEFTSGQASDRVDNFGTARDAMARDKAKMHTERC